MRDNKVAPQSQQTLWLIVLLIGLYILVLANTAHPEMRMNELSEVQNMVFHLSPRAYEFDAETDKADAYIDNDQADFFIWAAETPENLEVDGNYAYSVVDHELRDNDLEIDLDPSNACCPYPQKLYLSRHDIFRHEYINQSRPPGFFEDYRYHPHFKNTQPKSPEYQKRLNPPGFFIGTTHAKEPFHHDNVEMVYWRLNDYEVSRSEALHQSVTPGEDCISGYMINGYVRSRGCVSVWVGDTHFECSSDKPEQPKYTGKCKKNQK